MSAWREADFFTPAERAALELTEQITRLPGGVDDATWEEAAEIFSERELSDLILAVGTINLWNRLGVSTKLVPPPLKRLFADEGVEVPTLGGVGVALGG
ncbi:carboxymuconolactone decarboxylase family protein [Nesterenkonia alkaliphila]|uniref:carboxymuconolactone decarboxylase family protein n=1 Tax=Nesterenkonia alkaliphila TaxID=1463631 RepID=UPI0016668783|nr:carboxymuconolactone decarboxylase family protein [Nesterenkonia alkaliphila]GGA01216.1 hypothetical protein GCM10011359_31480 [Nesterenkonia alkaliphila]